MVDSLFPQSEERAPKRRRRGRGVIALAIVVVLLIVAVVVVNGISRSVVEGVIRDKVRTSLSIPDSTPVDVTVGGGSVLLQLLHRKLDNVTIAADAVSIGSFNGDASLKLKGLPLDQTTPVAVLNADFVVNDTQLKTLLTSETDLPVSSVAVNDGTVRVGSKVTVFGIDIPVGLRFTPGEQDGELLLTLKTVEFKNLVITPAKFKNILGFIVNPLIKTRHICVASGIPASLALDHVYVKGQNLYFGVSGIDVKLTKSLMSDKGTCS
ncbi:hypothetical protein BH09ACT1_BH09ACT1_11460 [soil metagenome]